MSKKILILSSSYRKGGNSEQLAAAFARGAEEAGHEVETIYLRDKEIGFCRGCVACLKLGHCVIQDDAVEIAAKMHDADVLVFATPVYYYSISGQLKTMLDRANPLYGTDYAFTKAYLLAAAAESSPSAGEGSVKAEQGWVDGSGAAGTAAHCRKKPERLNDIRRKFNGATESDNRLGQGISQERQSGSQQGDLPQPVWHHPCG